MWPEAEIHHIKEHQIGGKTTIENGVLVHRICHPKGAAAVEFAERYHLGSGPVNSAYDQNSEDR